jgi:calnexin
MPVLQKLALGAMLVAAGADGDGAEEAAAPVFSVPPSTGAAYFEDFQEGALESGKWVKSTNEKYKDQSVSLSSAGLPGVYADDKGLHLDEPAKHYGLATKFASPIGAGAGEAFVVQYELRLQEGLECGGAYIKLPEAAGFDAAALKDDTPYILMFGPDKCGGTNKVHFILRHQNPVSKKWTEHHAKSPPAIKADRNSHLYTLAVRPDNSFEIFIDQVSALKGDLLADLEPAINPPKDIDDPADSKPADWVDEEKIKDPEAKKPEDWDEDEPMEIPDAAAAKPAGWLDDAELKIPDPAAAKPEDWDEEEDGEFEAPIIDNPACVKGPGGAGCGKWVRPFIKNPKFKGKWVAPLVENPAYKGEWKAKQIANPSFFVEEAPAQLPAMGGVGIEVWTMSKGLTFDNFFIGHDEAAAAAFGAASWKPKHLAESTSEETARNAAAKKARARKLAEGGVMNTAEVYVMDGLDVMAQNIVASVLSVCAGLIAIMYLCCKGDGDEEVATEAAAPRAGKPALHRTVTATTDLPVADAKAAGAAGGEDDDDSESKEVVEEDSAASAAKKKAGAGAKEEDEEDSQEDEGEQEDEEEDKKPRRSVRQRKTTKRAE